LTHFVKEAEDIPVQASMYLHWVVRKSIDILAGKAPAVPFT